MSDSVKEISGAEGTIAGGNYSGGSFPGQHKKRGAPALQADLIEISKDARDRLKGKPKKGILEYLRELWGE